MGWSSCTFFLKSRIMRFKFYNGQTIVKRDELICAFTWLRFPLMCLVVFIHLSYPIDEYLQLPLWCQMSLYLLSDGVSRIAVPLFFLISGFFFFLNYNNTLYEYINKLKRRVVTLFVPYVMWNTLYIIHNSIRNTPPQIENLVTEYWNHNGTSCPICYPMWFIANLMIIVLFSPLVYVAIKNFNKAILLFLPCLLLLIGGPHLSAEIVTFDYCGFIFYSIGAYMAINLRFFKVINVKNGCWGVCCVIFILTFVMDVIQFGCNDFFSKVKIVSGVFVVTLLTLHCFRKTRIPRFITSSSFFLFGSHILIMRYVKAIVSCMLNTDCPITYILLYVVIVFLTILISLVFFLFVSRFMPSFAKILTGNRNF